jgi:polyisoprenoid-binding protein YceI
VPFINQTKKYKPMSTSKWVLDPAHSEVSFKVKHLMISTVTGNIGAFNVQVESAAADFSDASIQFTAELGSLNTNNEQRDGHLKSPDFFDVEKFPTLSFVSESVTKKSDTDYVIKGNLTIKDVTKSIEVPAEFGGSAKDPWGNAKAGFSLDFKINREDFGLSWNAALETGGVLVSNEVRILAEIQLLQQVEVPA